MSAAEETGGAPLLTVRDLYVGFGRNAEKTPAVRGLNLTVRSGETVAIVGESGSGKSVSALSMVRLVEFGGGRITGGEILLRRRNGQEVDLCQLDEDAARELRGDEIAMIFQEPMTSLNPVFTVGDQLVEAIVTHRDKSRAAARATALEMLQKVRIPNAERMLKRHPHQLSGGMRQRVMIAMALACRPQLLIADEPTTALDVTIQAQILGLVRDLQDDEGMSVLFITHDMGVVAEIADRVIVMYHGEKVEEGPVAEIFAAPKHPYTKALLAAVPKLGAMAGTDTPRPFDMVRAAPDAEGGDSTPTDPAAEPQTTPAAPTPVDYAAEPILSVRGLTTAFDIRGGLLNRVNSRVHAVEGIDLDIWAGETLGLVGESGCGKSTTGRSILRLVDSHADQLHFAGNDLTDMAPSQLQRLRRDVQFIFQDPYASLDPRLTVGYSICEPMLIHGLETRRSASDKAAWLLEQVGLSPEHADRYPHAFSGGQRQRIAIARALSTDPKLVIADEAVSALDVSIQAQVVNLMMELQQRFGLAYLFISHDMAVVERVSHRVAVMYLGQIVEAGTRRAVFENPQHPYTRRLMAAAPVPDPESRNRTRVRMTGEVPSPVRAIGDPPVRTPLKPAGEGHFIADPEGFVIADPVAGQSPAG
ncbi:dipeptide ABC transporter ATP-binding protein [Mesobaculum littorinae]|uniref:Glutathione import ATP-binding protein GsiA n=1 Tax=Mesobaculum littorinae TaxID=2486419 RepID=A0A438AKN1_9RHOB|nr:dipeptide ABC transporter ATP-binding protein [Mesobaculum littorinae]RVV99175.1 dipeptide ABC transporter ATP-binding protein [Mesobaculum littorinae]